MPKSTFGHFRTRGCANICEIPARASIVRNAAQLLILFVLARFSRNQIARTRHAQARHVKSKLEPHRAFIVAAVLEGLPITTVQGVLEEHCDLRVSYATGLTASRSFAKPRRPTAALRKPPLTKEQRESMAALEKRSPNDHLTLIKK